MLERTMSIPSAQYTAADSAWLQTSVLMGYTTENTHKPVLLYVSPDFGPEPSSQLSESAFLPTVTQQQAARHTALKSGVLTF